jgi:hypothetical protein
MPLLTIALAKPRTPIAKSSAPPKRTGRKYGCKADCAAAASTPIRTAATGANSIPGSMVYNALPMTTNGSPTMLHRVSPAWRR